MTSKNKDDDEMTLGSGSETECPPRPCHKPKKGGALESDSLPESSQPQHPNSGRRKRRLLRRRGVPMEVDTIHPSTSTSARSAFMEVDGFESQLSSSDESCDPRAGDADDEQSDWVGYSNTDSDLYDASERRARRSRIKPKVEMSQLQKRLERFALGNTRGEMGLEFRIKDRPNSADFNRLLLQYRLEVVQRQRGNVVIRKKSSSCPSVAE